MTLGLDNFFGIHAKSLEVRDKRAAMIANNLANVDTPNYKARDIDFKQALKQFDSQSMTLDSSNKKHLVPENDLFMAIKFRRPLQESLDGNSVDKDIETTEFARNSMQYQASLSFLDGKIKTVMTALRGE